MPQEKEEDLQIETKDVPSSAESVSIPEALRILAKWIIRARNPRPPESPCNPAPIEPSCVGTGSNTQEGS